MPRLLMAAAMCRMVGEVENTRAERLRVDELQCLLIAPILEEVLPVPNDDGMNHESRLIEEVASALLHGPVRVFAPTGPAGAGSMAMGEWISVQSARELYERQIEVERQEIARVPDKEEEELALIYEVKGLSEELGIDPEELGGSARGAAVSSYVLFALGAIVPVSPFLFLSGWLAIAASVLTSVAGLFAIGAATTLFTGRSVLFSGMRQVLVGAAAAALTYVLGGLLGGSVSG